MKSITSSSLLLKSVVFTSKRGFIASLFFICLAVTFSCGPDDGKSLFDRADRLSSDGRHTDAIAAYNDVALHYEKSVFAPDSLFRAGEIYYRKLNNFDAAIKEFKKLVEKYPESDKYRFSRKYMAHIYMYKLNDYKKAIIEYQKAIPYYHGKDEAEELQYEISKAYFSLGNFSQQRVELKLLLEAFPETGMKGDVSLQIANSFYVGGNLDDAIKSYRNIVKNFPNTPLSVEASLQLAVSLQENGDLKGAVRVLKEIRNIHPKPEIVKKRIERIEKRLKRRRR